MSGTITWEPVSSSETERLDRTSVGGGWLYRYQQRQGSEHGGYSWSIALAYVPEPPP